MLSDGISEHPTVPQSATRPLGPGQRRHRVDEAGLPGRQVQSSTTHAFRRNPQSFDRAALRGPATWAPASGCTASTKRVCAG